MTIDKQTATRRGVLAAIAGTAALGATIGAAIAAPVEAETEPTGEPDRHFDRGFNDGHDAAADAFAVVWLEQFTHLGGSVYRSSIDGTFSTGRPCYSLSPSAREFTLLRRRVRKQPWFKALPRKRRRAIERDARREAQTFWEGRVMALQDLLYGHVEGIEAVKRSVLSDPARGWPRKAEG